jgi:two-component system CheB/CheR fusion protein
MLTGDDIRELSVERGSGLMGGKAAQGGPEAGKRPAIQPEIENAPAAQEPCYLVGIGASTGGQEALEQLFTAMPADCGLSFVVIMHLPADGPLFLAEMLGRYTRMEVVTAEDGMRLCPNRIHVMPAGRALTVSAGRLRIEEELPAAAAHHPINRFFFSLAAEAGQRAVAVVLSGFGTDGSAGVKSVREAGGIVIVQDPDSASNPAMPKSAIAGGVADLVLPAEEIPARIAEIARGRCSLPPRACREVTLDQELAAVFSIVKARTGHDFSSYKSNTVMRRIERRLAVNDMAGLGKYIALLEDNPREAQALCRDILIGVTSFFRDPDAFGILADRIIPRLLAQRDPGDPLRIWHACCATGEEVYSMAMLVREYLDRHRLDAKVLIFATDIDEVAIAQARAGLYGDDIEAEVGQERLKAFFTRSDGRWQVAKSLREMVVFAHHSLIKDPPFSRLDLLVCRNFLIYLNPDMQKRLIALFHQVLKPHGFLFLGASETVGHQSELFEPVDKKWKLFQRLESGRRNETLFPFTAPVRRPPGAGRSPRTADAAEPGPGAAAERLLLERYSPPCVVVNEKFELVHVSTRANRFLELPVGEPTRDILRMAREELRPSLRAAIYKAFADQKPVVFRGAKIDAGQEQATEINVVVEPVDIQASSGRFVMVIFEPVVTPAVLPAPSSGEDGPAGDESSRDMLVRQLEEQLRITHEQLQATTEQLESSNEGFMSANEELMSINEEFQSANEELQSSNEELETSKEELQALNEELVTVNAELQGKLEELNQANSDIANLLTSSEIATLFLDRQLAIKRFTPAMAGIFNLIASDIGRPFRHLAGTIDWSELDTDARKVLESLVPIEREVTAVKDGLCYIMRVLPYRNTAGGVDGIVVTLIDITAMKRAEEETRSAALFPLENPSPVLRVGRDGSLLFFNRSSEALLESWRSEYGKNIPDLLQLSIERSLANGASEECEISVLGRDMSFVVAPFPERKYANLYGREITKRKRAEEEIIRAKEEWERTFESVPDLITILDNQHRVLRVNQAMARRLGLKPEQCVGLRCHEAVHGTCVPHDFCPHSRTIADGCEHIEELHVERLGGDFLVTTTPLLDERGERIGSVHIAHDITQRKRMEDALRKSEERLKRAQEISHLGSWELDLVTNVLTWSDEAYRIFGLRPEGGEVTYQAFLEVVHPDDRTAVDAAYSGSLRDGLDQYEIEHRIVRQSSGEVRIVHEKCEHFRDASGQIIRSIGMVHDITERKRDEQERETTVEFLRLVNESSTTRNLIETAICFFQGKSGCEAVGVRLREGEDYPYFQLCGFPREFVEAERTLCGRTAAGEIVRDSEGNPVIECMCGKVICERFDPSKPFFTPAGSFWANSTTELLAGASEADRREFTRNSCNGEGYESVALIPLFFGTERMGLLQMNDHRSGMFTPEVIALWERLAGYLAMALAKFRTEAELRCAKESAEAASRAKSRFLANMSHELRTPMTGVLGMLDLALGGALEADQRDYLETAHKSAAVLLHILNEILDLSSIESGKFSIEDKPFSLARCLADSLEIFITEARRKGLELVSSLAGDLPQSVRGDSLRLRQVLVNLIGNALKFTEQGRVEVLVRNGSRTPEGKQELVFTVTDSGIGIPRDKRHLLFRSFSQVDDSDTRSYGGSGLGLAICQEIVTRMGGTIGCESEPGKGSSFFFSVPFGVAETVGEEDAPPVKSPALAVGAIDRAEGRKARLLIAEDEPVIRQLLDVVLRLSNFEPDFAEDGHKAVEMWDRGGYDLVLMDVQMPRMDGFSATRAIRERERARGDRPTLIVAMTAHAYREDEHRCLDAGMDAFISKPIDLQKSIALINGLISQRQGGFDN